MNVALQVVGRGRCGVSNVWAGAHLGLAHGHGVDDAGELFSGDWGVGAELFAAVLAEEDDGELVGVDVEAAAEGWFPAGQIDVDQLGVDHAAETAGKEWHEDDLPFKKLGTMQLQ